MTDLENAKQLLLEKDFTCVLCRDQDIRTSRFRGVKPLVSWYAGQEDAAGFCAADKVVGKATAFLYVLLGAKAVYAGVISHSALQVLTDHHIAAEYDLLVENIINRKGDGICPFEEAVLDIQEPQEAYAAIRRKMEALNISL